MNALQLSFTEYHFKVQKIISSHENTLINLHEFLQFTIAISKTWCMKNNVIHISNKDCKNINVFYEIISKTKALSGNTYIM